jgi:hypothetical protein
VTFWAEIFLGVIALATLTMAAVQVGLVVYGWTLARRVNRLLDEVERQLQPLSDSLNAVARDAARVSSMAAVQIERVDRLMTDLTSRIEHTATTVQDAVLRPLREGAAILAAVKGALGVFREGGTQPPAGRRSEEEDALFIG